MQKILWQPVLGEGGYLTGILLDRGLALQCQAVMVDSEMVTRCLSYVWRITKPADWDKGYMPSNILQFDNGTMLPSLFQHYADHGKWLDMDRFSLQPDVEDDQPIVFSLHHTDGYRDQNENRWLQFAFSRWVQFMSIKLESG